MSGQQRTHLLMMVEGDTEIIFYALLKEKNFKGARTKPINLEGNWNIEMKVLEEASRHAESHPNVDFTIAICIDRESRSGKAPIRLDVVRESLVEYKNIGDIHLFEAIQDIECWLFHDVEGIFEFIRLPRAKRDPAKYKPVEKLNHRALSGLFETMDKEYRKGKTSRHFLESLDLDKILAGSTVLREICSLAKKFE